MTPFYITIATVCIQTLITNGKGVESQDVCKEMIVQKSTIQVFAKANETVLNVVSREWLEEQIKLIDAAKEALGKTTDYYFAEADRTYCDRHAHIWQVVKSTGTVKQTSELCGVCGRKRRKAMKEDWIIEP